MLAGIAGENDPLSLSVLSVTRTFNDGNRDWSGDGSRNRRAQAGSVVGHRLFELLNEVRPLPLGRQFGRAGFGCFFL